MSMRGIAIEDLMVQETNGQSDWAWDKCESWISIDAAESPQLTH